MALDMVAVMAALGFERFALAGHDRGGRVAYRLALDHPERVSRLAVLDIVPTLEMAETVDLGLAIGTYHWFFLAQPTPLPERLIAGDPAFYLDFTLDSWAGEPAALDPEARAQYRRCFRQDSVVAAACADYRAGLTTDLDHDRADRRLPLRGGGLQSPLWTQWGQRQRYRRRQPGHRLDLRLGLQ